MGTGFNSDELLTERYTAEELRDMQLKDPTLLQLIRWKEEPNEPTENEIMTQGPAVKHFWLNNALLTMKNGVLFYNWYNNSDSKLLLMLPNVLKQEVLKGYHDSLMAGHTGITNTKENIRKNYIWYKMSHDIEQYVKSCGTCARNKKANRKAKAGLKSYHSGYPVERVHMDILGPFTKSKKGNAYILMIIDQFTKWIEAIPIPNQTAKTIANACMNDFFSRFGVPIYLHTDQGKNFDGCLMQSLCKLLHINKTRTTPFHPSSNGQIERYNRTLLQMIHCFVEK